MKNPFYAPMVDLFEFELLPVEWSDVVNLVSLEDHLIFVNQHDLPVVYHFVPSLYFSLDLIYYFQSPLSQV